MSAVVVISGTPEVLYQKIVRVLNRFEGVRRFGFRRFQSDEVWQYHNALFNVCPDCVPLDNCFYNGEELQFRFPFLVSENTIKVKVNNDTRYHGVQSCKCNASWTNFEACIIDRIVGLIRDA